MNPDGVRCAWERTRSLIEQEAHRALRTSGTFEPGDFACCAGSIQSIFYRLLEQRSIPLNTWERNRKIYTPNRFCVVNRKLQNGSYEVFVLTTFGQARLFEELGPFARKYGIPLGGMKWPEDIRPIMTYPASFGWDKKSFIFGIPTVVPNLLPALTARAVRLVPGELHRLRKISSHKLKTIRRDHWAMRHSLQSRRAYEFGASMNPTDVNQDDFLRCNEVDDDLEDLEPYLGRGQSIPLPRKRFLIKSFKRSLPIRHDITWVMRFASNDILNFSTYLSQRGIHRKVPSWIAKSNAQNPQTPLLPAPYYAPSLRVNIATSPIYLLNAKAELYRLKPPRVKASSLGSSNPAGIKVQASTLNSTSTHHRNPLPRRKLPHAVANLLRRTFTTLVRKGR